MGYLVATTVTIKLQSFLDVVGAIVFVVVMATVSGRLLGVRTGRLQVAAASVIGCLAGIAGAASVGRHRSLPEIWLLAVLFGVLATMVLTIVMEALRARRSAETKPRARRLLLHPIRWLRGVFAPIGRSWEVVRNARRRGLAKFQFVSAEAVTTAEFGRRLRLTLEDSGGMFVKFGQIASTRSDLLGDPVTTELAELRSSVRPIPPDELRGLLEAELDRPVEEAFASFEWEPLAAASIGQTHRAVLGTQQRVVVKIQRPGMEELLRRDATVLRFVAGLAERRIPGAQRMGARRARGGRDPRVDPRAGLRPGGHYEQAARSGHRSRCPGARRLRRDLHQSAPRDGGGGGAARRRCARGGHVGCARRGAGPQPAPDLPPPGPAGRRVPRRPPPRKRARRCARRVVAPRLRGGRASRSRVSPVAAGDGARPVDRRAGHRGTSGAQPGRQPIRDRSAPPAERRGAADGGESSAGASILGSSAKSSRR